MAPFLDPSQLSQISLKDIRRSRQPLDTIPIPSSVDMLTTQSYRLIPATTPLNRCELVDALKNKLRGSSFFGNDVPFHPLLRGNLQHAERGVVVRRDMLTSLRAVNKTLEPYGYELFLHDGYRTAACQAEIRRRVEMYWHDKGESFLSEEGLKEFCENNADKVASRATAEPDPCDPTTWFAHSTGASLNVTIVHRSGAPTEMGGMLLDLTGAQETNHYEVHTPRNLREEMARTNRRILFWSMALHGWYNYPHLYAQYDYCSEKATQFGIQSALAWNFADVTIPTCASIGPAC